MKQLIVALCSAVVFAQSAPHIRAAAAAYESAKSKAFHKQYQTAIDDFHRALEIEPTFIDAFDGLIAAYLDAGHKSDAAGAITQLLEITPNAIRYRVLLGHLLLEQDQTDRALAQFSFALKTQPLDPDALLGFAEAAKRAGMDARAAEELAIGRKQYPHDARFNSK
ncbi:MAG: tetratricopeptide repeat protein [Acidobacteriota bacterium]|nr:tetratricopeptide repeat protein [Acidobacteriota bacterium]